jgi:biopolymer transport protein ExbB
MSATRAHVRLSLIGLAFPAAALAEELTRAALDTGASHALARDLSVWGMFRDAGSAAKAVMILLAGCSLWNVTIWLDKALRLRAANRRADRFLAQFRENASIDGIEAAGVEAEECPMAEMCRVGIEELRASQRTGAPIIGEARDRLAQRIESAQQVVHAEAAHALGDSMSVLATIGATAPFIGLFGTVYGIMTSFIGIAQTQTTNLAVVAPGIAEALLATAVGLFAAIPAVVLYNKFSRDIAGFLGRLATFRSEFALALARQLDLGGR